MVSNKKGKLRVQNPLIREFMAEFLGTFIILVSYEGWSR